MEQYCFISKVGGGATHIVTSFLVCNMVQLNDKLTCTLYNIKMLIKSKPIQVCFTGNIKILKCVIEA